jgi:hypothetical protein
MTKFTPRTGHERQWTLMEKWVVSATLTAAVLLLLLAIVP